MCGWQISPTAQLLVQAKHGTGFLGDNGQIFLI
jgi:hypothetical protein